MNKFDVREATVAALSKEKKPDCVEALAHEFGYAVDTLGLSFREAYYYAEVTHFLKDHDGYNNLPELTGEETDEAVRSIIQADIDDGKSAKEAGYLMRWYNLVRTWDTPVALAFSTAINAGMEEWEDDNDLDEATAIAAINQIPSEEIVDTMLLYFYTLRNEGNSVRASVRIAEKKTEEVYALKQVERLFSLLGNRGDLSS